MKDSIFSFLPRKSYLEAHYQIKNGDLLLCSGNGTISTLIKEMTGSQFSHVGLLLQLPITNQWLVLESVESIGVRCVTLKEGYLKNYRNTGKAYDGKLVVARHEKMKDKLELLPTLYQKAFELVGDLYSDKDMFKIATRIALDKVGISEEGKLLDDDKYICSEFVYTCLKEIQITIPYNKLGFISPADIANNDEVDLLFCIKKSLISKFK